MTKPTPKYTRMLELIRDVAALTGDDQGQLRDVIVRAQALTLGTGKNNPKISAARARAVLTHKAKGAATRKKVLPIIARLRREGTDNYAGLAAELNELGVEAPKGGKWYSSSVRRVELGS